MKRNKMTSAAKSKPSLRVRVSSAASIRSILSTSIDIPTSSHDANCQDRKNSNYPEQKSKILGLDGAECSIVDLSSRGLTTSQVERTLRVFETAFAMDLSQNELERIPMTFPKGIFALDLSFNMISILQGVEHLGMLQEINLSYNRISDVSILEACPRLHRVNLCGNRLSTTRGLETLEFLEVLDLSENLIEVPDAMRPLSLNQNLIHLSLKGNPISMKKGYRVIVMDLMPSVLMLDEKKMKNSIKCKSMREKETNTILHQHTPTITATYSKLYDDKKQFVIQSHKSWKRPIQRDTKAQHDTVDAILHPDISTARIRVLQEQLKEQRASPPPAPVQSSTSSSSTTTSSCPSAISDVSEVEQSNPIAALPAATSTGSYMSMYDRIARLKATSMVAVNPGTPGVSHVNSPRNAPQVRPLPPRPEDFPMPQGPMSNYYGANVSPLKPRPSMRVGSVVTQRKLSFVAGDAPATGDATQGIKNSRSISLVSGRHPASRRSSKTVLDDKQANVLSVINGLIAHKKQTLVNLTNVNNSTTYTQNRVNTPSGTAEASVRRSTMGGNGSSTNSRVGSFTQPKVAMVMR